MLPYIELFGRQIPMYAVCVMAGLVIGITVALLRAGIYQLNREDVLYASFYGILGLIAGGKILYLITMIPFLVKNFSQVIGNMEVLEALMTGGFVFYGGFLGAIGGIWLYTRLYHLKTVEMLENMIPSVPLIHAFGRIGCFCAGCCYGREVPESWGIVFEKSLAAPNHIPLFPIQLAESAGNLVLFFLLLFLFWKKRTRGQIAATYIMCYSFMRFFLEYFRADAERGIWLGFSTSQWISAGLFLTGIFLWKKLKRDIKTA